MKLELRGDVNISQFRVVAPGLYAWRQAAKNGGNAGEWNIGHLNTNDRIDGQYEGCGPLFWGTADN